MSFSFFFKLPRNLAFFNMNHVFPMTHKTKMKMKINSDKCEVIYFVTSNQGRTCIVNGRSLECFESAERPRDTLESGTGRWDSEGGFWHTCMHC